MKTNNESEREMVMALKWIDIAYGSLGLPLDGAPCTENLAYSLHVWVTAVIRMEIIK